MKSVQVNSRSWVSVFNGSSDEFMGEVSISTLDVGKQR